MVVVGILVAIALNSWYQGRTDSANARNYLVTLSRDLQGTLDDLASQAAFEQARLKDGVMVYRALSDPLPSDTMPLSLAISRLSQRKTLVLKDSAYRDLLNTGNLRLIHNRVLRNHIISFYETTALQFAVLNKNNAFFVDQMFTDKIILSGLIVSRLDPNDPLLTSDTLLVTTLRDGFLQRHDALWDLPPNAPQWAMVRSNIVARLRISALNNYIATTRTQAAKKLKDEIDAQLQREP